jgi:hypothetical protein
VFVGVGAVIGILGKTTFRPLPFSHPESLVQLTEGGNIWDADTLAATLRLAPEVAAFATFASSNTAEATHGTMRHTVSTVQTSPNFFDVLGTPLRRINPAAYRSQRGSAVISTTLARQLGIDGEAMGSAIRIGDRSFTVVGLLDPLDAFPVGTDLWYAEASPGPIWLGLVRTRTPTDIDALVSRLDIAVRTVTGDPREMVSGHMIADVARPSMPAELRAMSAGIVLFAVIAVLNYGLLGIGEARRREQEFAIRVALGAGRAQVAREFAVAQLRLIGIAIIAAAVLLSAARVVVPWDMSLPVLGLPPLIWALLGMFACILLLVAIIPRRIASGAGEMEVLRRVGARSSRFEQAWNRGLVGTQFAVTAFLLVAGGTAVLTLRDLQHTAYGFETDHLLIGSVALKSAETDAATQRAELDIEAAARSTFAGHVAVFTIGGRTMEGGPYRFETDPPTTGATAISNNTLTAPMGPPWLSEDISPEFFDIAGVRMVAGRKFRATDDAGSEPVVILSESAARRFGGTQQALGKRLKFGEDDGEWRTIVGVAADAYPIEKTAFQFQLLGRKRPWARNIVYRPFRQIVPHEPKARVIDGRLRGSLGGVSILLRNPSPDAATRLTAMLGRVAPDEKFSDLLPLARYIDWRGEIDRAGFTTRLIGQFAIAGFLLALIGAVVLIDEVVRSRTIEIGIRRALGAQSASLVRLASRETFIAGMIGVIVGTIVGGRFGAVVSSWMRATPLFEERVLAPITLSWTLMVGAPSLLLLLIAIASALRALRAARLDPMEALRTA